MLPKKLKILVIYGVKFRLRPNVSSNDAYHYFPKFFLSIIFTVQSIVLLPWSFKLFTSSHSLRPFWKEIFLSITNWKTFECLTESFFDKNGRNFQELLFKVWGIECCFLFLSKCVSVRVEKTNDRWRYYRHQKNTQNCWNCAHEAYFDTIFRMLLHFYEKMKNTIWF